MIVRWLGRVEYLAAWQLQKELADLRARGDLVDTLLLLEHPSTLTLGRSAERKHLLVSEERLNELGLTLHEVDRGGDITYHGPGQLVGYPIFDLGNHGKDIHKFLRDMEQALIELLSELGVSACRFPPHTGVWLGDRKIAAMGVKVRKWISTHGFALNVNPDLSHFNLIVPCGIRTHGVTSLSEAGFCDVHVNDLLTRTAVAFESRFGSERHAFDGSALLLSPHCRAIWTEGMDV